MTRRPCREDLEQAATWLALNEGQNGEAEACSRVATWLEAYAREADERSVARETGCSVRYLRKLMTERGIDS